MNNKYNVIIRDVGVCGMRIQIDDLHDAHIELINIMLETHKRLIIVLGVRPIIFTAKNALTFQMRKQAFFEVFGNYKHRITLLYINDVRDDHIWSNNFDNLIKNNIKENETVRCCGGRDSFLNYYHNNIYEKWVITDFTQSEFISATAKRNEIAKTTIFDSSFRRGVIYSALNLPGQCVPSIDVAIYDHYGNILMGQRVDELSYRFIGGWVQPRETFEMACNRIVKTKCGIAIDNLQPIRSFCNFDWKFKGERDDLTTMLYTAYITEGTPEPLGNLKYLRWVSIVDILNVVDSEHLELAKSIYELHNASN